MLTAPEVKLAVGSADRMLMFIKGLDEDEAGYLAQDAVYRARQRMPRVTGVTAQQVSPISGRGWFGLSFPPVAWYQEHGTKARTMYSLAGKTIPMWLTDTDGTLRRDNPKAQVRRTEDGRTQVLIFRRAAKIGSRVVKSRRAPGGGMTTYSAPASYPGAPGRINRRNAAAPFTPSGLTGGRIALGNGGVRWRHPGVRSMQNMNTALAETAFDAGLIIEPVYSLDDATMAQLVTRKAA